TVEITKLVPVTVEEGVDVVLAREADDLVDHVGMTESEVRRVIRPEGAAQSREAAGPVRLVAREGDHLRPQVAVVLVVTADAIRGVFLGRVEALGVDAVDATALDAPAIDQIGDRADEAEVLVL